VITFSFERDISLSEQLQALFPSFFCRQRFHSLLEAGISHIFRDAVWPFDLIEIQDSSYRWEELVYRLEEFQVAVFFCLGSYSLWVISYPTPNGGHENHHCG
jgi:hypothetical protein